MTSPRSFRASPFRRARTAEVVSRPHQSATAGPAKSLPTGSIQPAPAARPFRSLPVRRYAPDHRRSGTGAKGGNENPEGIADSDRYGRGSFPVRQNQQRPDHRTRPIAGRHHAAAAAESLSHHRQRVPSDGLLPRRSDREQTQQQRTRSRHSGSVELFPRRTASRHRASAWPNPPQFRPWRQESKMSRSRWVPSRNTCEG